MSKRDEEFERAGIFAAKAAHVLGEATNADAVLVIIGLDADRTNFHMTAVNKDAVMSAVIEAACSVALTSYPDQAEAFDRLTTAVMTKFNEIKDYEITTRDLTEGEDDAPAH